jgi:GNAT superfamily N-acetyltransferase
MADMLMVAEPMAHRYPPARYATKFLTADEFYNEEKLIKRHDDIIWDVFNTHGKYMKKVINARWFAVAVDHRGNYVSSGFVIDSVETWIIENVMTDPKQQGAGAGGSVMTKIMREAKKRRVSWAVLHCDAQKNDGQLPGFYGRFGFNEVHT